MEKVKKFIFQSHFQVRAPRAEMVENQKSTFFIMPYAPYAPQFSAPQFSAPQFSAPHAPHAPQFWKFWSGTSLFTILLML